MGRSMKTSLIGASLLSLAIGARSLAAPPLPAEHLTMEKVPPNNAHRIYVLDEAFFNEIDARVHLFDGDTHRRLGQIDAGFSPGFNLSPDGKTTVVATTYFSRGSRGTRTDLVAFNDNTTLSVTPQILRPPRRPLTLPPYCSGAYSSHS